MELERIKLAVEEAVSESYRKSHTRADWTKNIKEHLYQLAKVESLYVCASGLKKSDWPQWLYDLAVLQYEKSGSVEILQKAILAVECEWNNDDQSILEDFQKLLVCNSDFKLMIYYNNAKILPAMKKMIASYKRSNGTFLLAHVTADSSVTETEVVAGIRNNLGDLKILIRWILLVTVMFNSLEFLSFMLTVGSAAFLYVGLSMGRPDWRDHLELGLYSMLWLGFSAATFLAGIRHDNRAFRGFSLTFIIIKLYTRYYEYFWNPLDKWVFFIVIGDKSP